MSTSRRAQAYMVHYRSGETSRPERAIFLESERAMKFATEHHGSVVPLQEQISVTIKQCKQHPSSWYANKVGHTFAVLAIDDQGIWTRGDEGFINVIDWRDI